MRRSTLFLNGARAAGVVLAWLVAASCSASSEDSSFGNNGGDGGSGTGGSGAGTSGSGGNLLPDASMGDGDLGDAACAGDSFPGKLAPLDVYVLLDATGSMNGAGDTPVVWPSVTSALISIANDPMSTGIGIGLTYLPNPPPAGFHVPGSCVAGGDCGGLGTCRFLGAAFACDQACTSDADCGLYGPCLPLLQYKVCNGAIAKNVSCDPVDYGQPVVPIAELPGNKDAFINAINAKEPDGDATPTQPSLAGTLMYAHQWAVDHPSRLVHVLFATDGLPNNCTYNTIEGAAAAAKTAFEGVPSVPTFVLGIGDLSTLDKIASEGGTGQAYIANGSNVADTLVDVFNDIRANGACQFQIPPPEAGETLDYNQVNVYYTPLGATDKEPVKYVENEGGCDPVEGGWYFDDPTETNPTKILLCPATCEGVKLSEEGVEVNVGCLRIVK